MTWYLDEGPESDVVISTRVRLARNIENEPFPWRMSLKEMDAVKERVASAFRKVCEMSGEKPLIVDLGTLGDIESRALAEKRIISRDMLKNPQGKSLLLCQGESAGILVNEEDHLRLYAVGAGLCLRETAERAMAFAGKMESRLPFAYSDCMGYLTTCPTNTGTGMRASAMLHVPGLIRAGVIERLTEKLTRAGYVLRGAEGEGSGAFGDIIQLSNQVTLGISEERILSDLGQLVREVADEERRSRRRLLEKGRLLIEDEIGRAKGQLMGARLMSTEEAMRLLSLVRLGRELEIPGMPDYPTIQRLFVGIGAGVIQQTAGRPLDPGRRDEERATLIREALHSSE